jgi:Na+-translocating ferredoxin:NAD+ oxidoreductase RnfD subunit
MVAIAMIHNCLRKWFLRHCGLIAFVIKSQGYFNPDVLYNILVKNIIIIIPLINKYTS